MAKQELIAFGKDNVESKFELKLSQTDLVEAAVSEKEDEMYEALEAIQNELKAQTKAHKENSEAMTETAKAIVKAKYGEMSAKAEKALKLVNKNALVFCETGQIHYQDKYIVGNVYASVSSNTTMRAGGSLSLVANEHIPFNKEMKKLVKNGEVLCESMLVLREEESEINEKISNIDRLLRKAKAQITKKAIKGTGLAGMIPDLSSK